MTESWHDVDSPVIGRLRCSGVNVADRPRPRAAGDDLSVNHGGVAVVAGADVALSPITIDDVQPTSFEFLCVRAVVGRFTAIVVVLYRPGSAAVQQKFFVELGAILDRVATYQDRGTSSLEQSSSVRHRLPVSWHLQKISQDLFVFTVILEHRTTHY